MLETIESHFLALARELSVQQHEVNVSDSSEDVSQAGTDIEKSSIFIATRPPSENDFLIELSHGAILLHRVRCYNKTWQIFSKEIWFEENKLCDAMNINTSCTPCKYLLQRQSDGIDSTDELNLSDLKYLPSLRKIGFDTRRLCALTHAVFHVFKLSK